MNHSILTTQLDFLVFSAKNIVESGNWRLAFFLGLIAIVLYLVRRVDLYAPARYLWAYALASAIYVVEFPSWVYGPESAAFQATAGQNALEVILIPLCALVISEESLPKLFDRFKWVALVELLCVWFHRRGLMIAPSFNCALVALYLPFAPAWLWVLAVATIVTHHAGAAQVMLAVYAVLWAWENLNRKIFWVFAAVAPALLVGLVYAHSDGPMLDGLGRLDRLWGRYQLFWLFGDPTGATRNLNWIFILFGVGPATFTWISLKIDQFREPNVLFMHNDFMQIPWELGLVGLGLALIVYVAAVKRSWADFRLRMAFAALVPFGLLWHPLRFFPSAFLVALLFRLGLNGKGLSLSEEPPGRP